jgi:hypothetical protein
MANRRNVRPINEKNEEKMRKAERTKEREDLSEIVDDDDVGVFIFSVFRFFFFALVLSVVG